MTTVKTASAVLKVGEHQLSEDRQEALEALRIEEREASKVVDKITKTLGPDKYFITDQVFPWLVKNVGGRLVQLRVGRWYISEKIIVDTFLTQAKYDAADVPLRRKLCKANGVRYAALGPADKLASLVPQLGL